MIDVEKKQSSNGGNFDEFMFGRKRTSNHETEQKQPEEESNFDLFETSQTIMDTYRQLSPYAKEVSNLIKKFKK